MKELAKKLVENKDLPRKAPLTQGALNSDFQIHQQSLMAGQVFLEEILVSTELMRRVTIFFKKLIF